MKKFNPIHSCLKLVLLIVTPSFAGCLESSFELAAESRLPKWFETPEGTTRSELQVTMDYYSTFDGGESVFKLYKNGSLLRLKKATGIPRFPYSNELKNPPPGFPEHYPSYAVITVDGVTDIIEHRKMKPLFYVTDDPAVWEELGVEQTKIGKQ